MQAFLKALTDRCAAIMANYGARVFFGWADPDTEMPYMTVTTLDAIELERQTGGDVVERRPVMLSVYGVDPDKITDILKLIENSFEGSLLSLTSGKCLGSYQVSSNVVVDPDRDDDGKEVFQGTSLTEFDIQRSLTS